MTQNCSFSVVFSTCICLRQIVVKLKDSLAFPVEGEVTNEIVIQNHPIVQKTKRR